MSRSTNKSEYDQFIRKPVDWNPDHDIKFQVVSWFDKDIGEDDPMDFDDSGDDDSGQDNNNYGKRKEQPPDPKKYTMFMSGVTEKGESVTAKVNGFLPFFYVKIPERWSQTEVERFIGHIHNKSYNTTDEFGSKTWHKYNQAITRVQVVKKHDIDAGFTNGALFPFIGIQFKSYNAFQQCSWLLWKEKLKTSSPAFGIEMYESNIPPLLRYMHIQKILSVGWVTLPAGKYLLHALDPDKDTFCQIEAEIDWTDVVPDPECNLIAPIRQASFDIECFSFNGQMPVPNIEANPCIQIATAIKDYGRPDFTLKCIMTLKKSNPIEGALVLCYETEAELLVAWTKFMQTIDPDILIGYNIFGFDMEYLYVRSQVTKCEEAFRFLSKFKNHACKLEESQLKSSAYGDNHWQMVEMPGRAQIDLLPVIKKEKSYTSYTLKFVSTEILKETKHDLSAPEIFEYYRDGSVEKITIIAEYCIQDTLLPQKIIDKMNILVNLLEMAKVTRVPLDFLITRGQQIKVFSQICETARNANYLVPHIKKSKFVARPPGEGGEDDDEEEEGYEGATVLPPSVGSYWDGVAALDFKALYPTTEIDWNFCYTTLVKDDKKYGNIPGIQYHIVEIVIQKGSPAVEVIIFEAAHELTLQFRYFPKTIVDQLKKIPGLIVLPPDAVKPIDPAAKAFIPLSPWIWKAKFPLDKLKTIQKLVPQATIKKIYKWAQNVKGLIPEILINLLNSRSRAKKKMEAAAEAGDKFMEDVFNGAQLALKVSCNSVYGFTGCTETGKLPCKPIAECTTTIGRGMIESSKQYGENLDNFTDVMKCTEFYPEDYAHIVMNTTKKSHFMGTTALMFKLFKLNINDHETDYFTVPEESGEKFLVFTKTTGFDRIIGFKRSTDPKTRSYFKLDFANGGELYSMKDYSCDVIYGDTDSVFCNFDTTREIGIVNKVAYSMVVGAYVADKITQYLRSFNHFKEDKDKWCELEYEKVYGNLLLFTKKRYAGTFYDFNPLKYKYIDKKGIALKRRDYCEMVKDVYAGSLKILFDESYGEPPQRIETAAKVVMGMITDLLKGNVAPEKLILSKSLRDSYKIREKKKRKTDLNTFNQSNVFVKDHLIINHNLLGKTHGVVIAKREMKMNDFFNNSVQRYPLELRIESCENDELLASIDSLYTGYQGLPFSYEDIEMREGFEITLKRIVDAKTTEKELEPVTQAHVRLTRRMYLRDPGSAPVSGERVPYMFVEKKGNVLQHEKAEHPDYVTKYNLKPDPKYYLDNQLRKPIRQLFELLMPDPDSLFDPLIREYRNNFGGQSELTNYFIKPTDKVKVEKNTDVADNTVITASTEVSKTSSGEPVTKKAKTDAAQAPVTAPALAPVQVPPPVKRLQPAPKNAAALKKQKLKDNQQNLGKWFGKQ